ncbi:MAG TPA: hypothetical protein VKA27_18395 [Sunxiuqinia sp.]|nr:hypothetical protein [Sunxiuqinia sp.]
MKAKKNYLMILVGFLLLLSCSKKDGTNLQKNVEGQYKMEAFQYRYVETNEGSVVTDTMLVVDSRSSINILHSGAQNETELKLDDFIVTIINKYIEAINSNVTIEIEPPAPRLSAAVTRGKLEVPDCIGAGSL